MAEVIIFKEPKNYESCYQLLQTTYCKRLNKEIDDHFFALEHEPVFTIGRRGSLDNLLVPEKKLLDNNIKVVRVNRGGDITFHAPGQLVVYPVINLNKTGLGIKEYIYKLEETIIGLALTYNVQLNRSNISKGLWYKSSKISNVGISVNKGITLHGISLNISLDLDPFSWINPCGNSSLEITSLEDVSASKIHMDEVKDRIAVEIVKQFGDYFND